MKKFGFLIGDGQKKTLGAGWVFAETDEAALELLGTSNVTLIPISDDYDLPVTKECGVHWKFRSPVLDQ